jgi:hypothetical protein
VLQFEFPGNPESNPDVVLRMPEKLFLYQNVDVVLHFDEKMDGSALSQIHQKEYADV